MLVANQSTMRQQQIDRALTDALPPLLGCDCRVWSTTPGHHASSRGFYLQVMWGKPTNPRLWGHWRYGTMFRDDFTCIGTFELEKNILGQTYWSATLAGLDPDEMRIERLIRDAVLMLV